MIGHNQVSAEQLSQSEPINSFRNTRFDEAIEVAQEISAIDPDDILAHTSLSILYQKKGMVPEAEAEANKARILGWKQQLKKPGG